MTGKRISLFLVFIFLFSFGSLSVAKVSGALQSLVKVGSDLKVSSGEEVETAVAIGGSVTVFGRVIEDAVAIGGDVILKSSAVVKGNVVSLGGTVYKDPGAVLRGDTVEIGIPGICPMVGAVTRGDFWQGLVIARVVSTIGFMILAAILIALFTPQLGKISAAIEKGTWNTFLWGLLSVILFVPVIFVLVISIVGIVLIPVWVGFVFVALIFGYIAAAQLLGKKFLAALKKKQKPMMLEALLGIVLLLLVGWVPLLGWMVKVVASCCGLGAVVLTRFGTQKT